MKTFKEFITNKSIESILIKMRAKIANQRNKKHLIHLLSSNENYNYHKPNPKRKVKPNEKELFTLLPTRRKWKKLRKENRVVEGNLLNPIKKNELILKKTIAYYRKYKPKEHFIGNLDIFIDSIINSINKDDYNLSSPEIYPKLNDVKSITVENVCRPISIYPNKDKIIICLTNRYFTQLFDDFFHKDSFAFRSPKFLDNKKLIISHHDAIKKINDYRKRLGGKKLWVAECDMQKFYDSVNHNIVKKAFNKLLKKVEKKHPGYIDNKAVNIFYKYLDSYSFNYNVSKLDQDYFDNWDIPNGKFKWLKNEFIDSGLYKSIENENIGVPQGGALSGLIANIVLDYADKKVTKNSDDKLLYVRFCDDMLIMHPNKKKCLKAIKVYKDCLRKLKLLPHKTEPDIFKDHQTFWKSKTKGPYEWSNRNRNCSKWISFVGYDIHFDGSIRIRKKSLRKEIKKQKDTVRKILKCIKNGHCRKSENTVKESAINRLIGMSIGRVQLWNFENSKNEMCWLNGFTQINDNKYSRIQLKTLDRSRNKLIRKLNKKLESLKTNKQKSLEPRKRQLLYYGKPFSYYYHGIEKIKN